MKHSVLRICSAFLLLAIALVLTVSVIAAVSGGEEPAYTWTRIRFMTQGEQTLHLYDAQGKPLENVQTDGQGEGTSSLLPAGTYYAACMDGFAGFCLEEAGTLTVMSGGAEADGTTLYFTASQLGTLRIEREAKQEWYDYLLVSEDYRKREVIRCEAGEAAECVFSGIPYGSYTLEENGVVLCSVTVSAEKPNVVLTLPE